MYLSKSIVLVSLVAVMAAPSALAARPPIAKAPASTVCKGEGPYGPYGCVAFGNPATHILANESGKKARNAPASTVCKGEGPYGPYGCVAFGF